jgi:ribosome-associated protein
MIGWAETRSRINIKVKGSGQECPLHKLTGVPHRAAAGFGSVTMFRRFYRQERILNYGMKKNELKQQISAAIQACLEKKAEELSILEMEKGSGAFTDYFVLCSGTNPRQVQAIADEVELRLKAADIRPAHVEGYKQAEWVLLDYVDFVVHVFSEKARKFYDLERLWKTAKRLEVGDLSAAPKKKAAVKRAAKKPAPKPVALKKKKKKKA